MGFYMVMSSDDSSEYFDNQHWDYRVNRDYAALRNRFKKAMVSHVDGIFY